MYFGFIVSLLQIPFPVCVQVMLIIYKPIHILRELLFHNESSRCCSSASFSSSTAWLLAPPSLVSLNTPPKILTIPPRILTIPPRILTIPPRILTIPPRSLTTPPRSLTIPPRSLTTPLRSLTTPRSLSTLLLATPSLSTPR